jgi:DNA-binding MarR family transcriptional regulator
MKEERAELSPREIALMRHIRDGELPRREIAAMLGMPQPELTRLAKSLRSKGLLVVRRHGISTSLAFSEAKHASVLRRVLNEYSHMRLEEVLTLSTFRVIAALATKPSSTRVGIQAASGLSPRTIYTVLGRLREVGVVRVRRRGEYELADRFALFAELAREMASLQNQRRAASFSSDAIVVWEQNRGFMVRTRAVKERGDFRKTAFSAFDAYGVPVVQDWHYYYHPEGSWRRMPDEVLLHALLLRPSGSREINAMKMLWDQKELWRNTQKLREKAREYGVGAELESLIGTFKRGKLAPADLRAGETS